MPHALSLPPPVTCTLFIVWLFAVGGAVGSFLNVVVYRLPAGMSLIRPGSHCPACKHPIRWYDNVPVFGWIWLRGRCRDCGTRISPRYPIVEAITAGVFVLLGVVEILWGGANLPLRPELLSQEPDGVLWFPPTITQLCGILAYHLLLISTLIAAAGIEYDGHRAPVRLIVPALVAGLLAPVVWPHLHPVPAWQGLLGGPLAGLGDATAGLVAGAVLSLAAWPAVGRERGLGFLLASVCTGLFLGWQAAVVVVAATVTVHLLLGLLGRLWRGRLIHLPTTWLAAATLVWILAWRPIVAAWPALG